MPEQGKKETWSPKGPAVEHVPPAESFTHPATRRFFASLKDGINAESDDTQPCSPFDVDSESEVLESDIAEIEQARAALDRLRVEFVIDLGASRSGTR
jgi:hypothetical protein